jgi:hypothetical protein
MVRHGLQIAPLPCFLCLQEEDIAEHILMQCVCTREVWHYCQQELRVQFEIHTLDSTLQDWWMRERARFRDKNRKWFDGLVCTVSYAIWKNRKAFCFNNVQRQTNARGGAARVMEEYILIRAAHREGRGVFDNG